MGLFDKKQSISPKELKGILRKSSGRIPGTGGKKFSMGKREKIAKEIFGSKYGSQISRKDYKKALQGLEASQKGAKNRTEKQEIERKKEYLRELGGFKDYEI